MSYEGGGGRCEEVNTDGLLALNQLHESDQSRDSVPIASNQPRFTTYIPHPMKSFYHCLGSTPIELISRHYYYTLA